MTMQGPIRFNKQPGGLTTKQRSAALRGNKAGNFQGARIPALMRMQNVLNIRKDVTVIFGHLIPCMLAGNDEIHVLNLFCLFVEVQTLSSKTFCFVTNNLTTFGKRLQCFQLIDLC